MSRLVLALTLIVASLLTACGGAAAVHYGSEMNPAAAFGEARSYAFADRAERPPTGFSRVHVGTEIMERRIERRIRRDLETKGFSEVPREEASFVVFYGLGVEEVLVGAPSGQNEGWVSSQVNVHSKAAVIIDFVKADDGEHLWHGYAEGAVTAETIDYETAMNEIVDRIISRFNP
ncbi:MAG: DUF4136 domain-containing protein [Deltaproteobacteria bacterium]|nr:DUF4136 domain-containing protein [Deltaproteobacteria bacterium]